MCRIFTKVYTCGHSDPPHIYPCSAASIRGSRPEEHICHRSLEKRYQQSSVEDEMCKNCNEHREHYEKELQRRSNRVSRAFAAFDLTRVWEGSGGRRTSPETSPTRTTGFDHIFSNITNNHDGGSDIEEFSGRQAEDSHVDPQDKGKRTDRRDRNRMSWEMKGGKRVWKGYDPEGPNDDDFKAWGFAK